MMVWNMNFIFPYVGNVIIRTDEHILIGGILIGGLEAWNCMTFHSVGNVITPTDELIFFRGVG